MVLGAHLVKSVEDFGGLSPHLGVKLMKMLLNFSTLFKISKWISYVFTIQNNVIAWHKFGAH